MSTDRTRKEMLAIWADGAVDLPGSPVVGTTYGRSGITDVLVEAAWLFGTTVESATFNEVMRRITFLLSQLEDQGTLSWSSAITYTAGAFVMGNDEQIYFSLQNTNLNHEPTASPTYWRAVRRADEYYHLVDQKTAGIDAGTFTAGAWRTRTVNTEKTATSWASVASNQITLAAGTYRFNIIVPGFGVNQHKAKLYNVTDAADSLVGTTENNVIGTSAYNSDPPQTSSIIKGQITIASSKVFEIQHRCTSTYSTSGFGSASDFGVAELYTIVEIWRL